MQVTVESRPAHEVDADLLAVFLAELDPAGWKIPARLRDLDAGVSGRIGAVVSAGDFRGRAGETLLLYPDGEKTVAAVRVLLVGLGNEGEVDAEALRCAAGTAVRQACARRAASVAFALPPLRRVRTPAAAQAVAEGAVLGGYRFDDFKSEREGEERPRPLQQARVIVDRAPDARSSRTPAREGATLAECQNMARDLSNLPANELTPALLAQRAEAVAKEVGLRCSVLEVPELRRRKLGGILAVGQGSANPPRLVVLEHNAPGTSRGRKKAKKKTGRRAPTVCLVGKGITFDSGGISIKPGLGMEEMKHDMSGAAAVVGALRAAALLRIPLHVVGLLAAAENMPSGTAYRPGDIVRTGSGKTIEVLNTDAEGRVVLADALYYARTEYEPVAMLDLATLTGACVIALGPWATGAFGNNERLVEHVRRAGDATDEKIWPLPLWKDHRKAVRSEVADVKNTAGREGGPSTAAAFLAAFVEDVPWVHLDIAGTGWTSKPGPYQGRGATGVGVRLLVEVLRTWKAARVV